MTYIDQAVLDLIPEAERGERGARIAAHGDSIGIAGGQAPATETVAGIKAPLLLNYAGLDERINAGVPAFEAALKEGGKTYTLYMYDGAQHAFLNDTSEARYNEAAAELAWGRTLEFFKKHLAA